MDKELEELRDFKREIEKRDRQNLIDNIKKHLPDFEVKDTDDDTFLRGVLLGYEKMLQIQKKNEKRQKPKKIPSETGESPEEIPLWRQILD